MRHSCLLLLVVVVACANPIESRDPIPYLPWPYFYIGETVVNLEVDTRWLTFETTAQQADSIDATIRAAGVDLDSVTPLDLQHHLAWLGTGRSPASAEMAARLLRARRDVPFASAVYGIVSPPPGTDPCPYFFLDRLSIGLTDAKYEPQLLSFSSRLGAVLIDARFGIFTFRFPPLGDHTVLDVVELYRRQPFVSWAEAEPTINSVPVYCGGPS